MSLILANIIGWITSHWRIVLYITTGIILFVLIAVAFKSCGRTKLDEQQIQRVQEAIKVRNDAELRSVLAEVETKEQIVAGNVANAANETRRAEQKAKEKYANYNTQMLAEELESRK